MTMADCDTHPRKYLGKNDANFEKYDASKLQLTFGGQVSRLCGALLRKRRVLK